jgi:hypothetical protein
MHRPLAFAVCVVVSALHAVLVRHRPERVAIARCEQAGCAAIAVGSGALTLLLEAQEPFFGALVPVMGTIGAAAAVARFTWADA